MTPYVTTRWFRAPELLAGAPYGPEIDVWAAGCVAAQMIMRQPLFPGATHLDQWCLIQECFGDRIPRNIVQKQQQQLQRRAAKAGATLMPSGTDLLSSDNLSKFKRASGMLHPPPSSMGSPAEGSTSLGSPSGGGSRMGGGEGGLLDSAATVTMYESERSFSTHPPQKPKTDILSRLTEGGRVIPQALLDVVLACLEPDPLKRPTAQELLAMPLFQGPPTPPPGPASPPPDTRTSCWYPNLLPTSFLLVPEPMQPMQTSAAPSESDGQPI